MDSRRSRDVARGRLPLALLAVGALALTASAQTIDVNSADMFGDAFAFTRRGADPPCLVNVVFPPGAPLPFAAGFAGADLGNLIRAGCGLTIFTCPLRADTLGYVTMRGVGTQSVQIDWIMWTRVTNNCRESHGPPDYIAIADLFPFQATMNMQVNGAAGATLPLNYTWRNRSAAICDSEGAAEDQAGITGTFLTLDATDLFAAAGFGFDIPILPNVFAVIDGTDNGSVNVTDTIPFVVAVSGEPNSIIQEPGKGFYNEDGANAFQGGRLVISIFPIPPQLPLCPEPALEFSLDIGSDTELSDPNVDGDEVFDPGDMYLWFGPIFPGPTDGFLDDDLIFGFDHDPDPAVPTAAATCSALPPTAVLFDMFDLDGSDRIDIDLVPLIDTLAPVLIPIDRALFPDTLCIHSPEHIQISFDDDTPAHYVGTGVFCEVPVTSPSPILGNTFGQVAVSDEVLSILTAPGFPPVVLGPVIPILDEASLHASLAPSPSAPGDEDSDDDVDALDAIRESVLPVITCPWWCFTTDHEAVSLLAFDPGDIYCVDTAVAGSIPFPLIDDVIHLGLPDDTDIDAFEFAWVLNPDTGAENLALLFSIDDDDPLTLPDESGGIGLDPGMIYVSFFGGTFAPYLDTTLTDDVDAISVYCDFIQPPVLGACCFSDATCQDLLSPSDCHALGGQFMGTATDCAIIDCSTLIGACCAPGALCIDTLEIDCAQIGGGFLGVGTSCAVVTCLPCCLPTGRCVITASLAECATLQGTPGTPGFSCADFDCRTGACCWGCDADGAPAVCQETDHATCCIIQGLFAGPFTTCATNPCINLPVCRGDINGDNRNDVFDFGIFAANFGSVGVGRCEGDLDCNGTVDVFDFGIYAANFGCIGPPIADQCCSPTAP